MNDNEPLDYDLPDWAWDIVEKYDIGLRTDNPLGAARVLLADASELVREIVDRAWHEQTETPIHMQRLREAIDMLTDAGRMGELAEAWGL